MYKKKKKKKKKKRDEPTKIHPVSSLSGYFSHTYSYPLQLIFVYLLLPLLSIRQHVIRLIMLRRECVKQECGVFCSYSAQSQARDVYYRPFRFMQINI